MPKKNKKQELTEKEQQELYEEERKRELKLALYRQVRINELEDVFNNILEQIKLDPNYYYKNKTDIDRVIKEYSKIAKEVLENAPDKEVASKIKEVDKLYDSVNKIDNHYIDRMIEEQSISYNEMINSSAMLLELRNQYLYGYEAMQFMTYVVGTRGEEVACDTAEYLHSMDINVDRMCQVMDHNHIDKKTIVTGIDLVRGSNLEKPLRDLMRQLSQNGPSQEERKFFEDVEEQEEQITIGDGTVRGTLSEKEFDRCSTNTGAFGRLCKDNNISQETVLAVFLKGATEHAPECRVENGVRIYDITNFFEDTLTNLGFVKQFADQQVRDLSQQLVDTEEGAFVLTPPNMPNGNGGSGMMPM